MQVNIYINLLVYKYTYYVAYEQQDYFLWNPSNSPVIFAEKRLTASITKAKLISLYFIRYGQVESIIGIHSEESTDCFIRLKSPY